MSVRSKMKYLLTSKGGKIQDFATALGKAPSSFSRKMRENSYSLFDLIDIAKYTGTKLAFVNEDDKVIFTLTTTDLEEDQKMVAANAAKTKRKKK